MKFRYLKSTTLSLDSNKCTGCGRCTEVCPHEVFELENRKARIKDIGACMECGACMKNCPFAAITVDTGTGCAAAILSSGRKGGKVECGCSDSSSSCCG
jgi:NAD-dependent dihydropyrimidine dehydrogenase PreA subunit